MTRGQTTSSPSGSAAPGPVPCRPVASADLPAACDMIEPVFWEQVAPSCLPEGWQIFGRLVTPEAMEVRLRRGHAGFVALLGDGRIAGYAEITPAGHLLLLFVAKAHQRRGIGRQLLALCVAEQPERAITVNAAPNAVGAYRALDFIETGPAQHRNGITSVPMLRPAALPAMAGPVR